MNRIIKLLDLDEVNDVGKISLMGGELFDTAFSTELRELFYKLIDKIFSLKKRLFLMTNLIFDREVEFEDCLQHIESVGHIKDTVICTSFDLEGRFHNESSLRYFKSNCEYVKTKTDLHIEMILCSSLLNSVLNNEFKFKDFFKEYTYNVDFIPPYPGIDRKHLPEEFLKDFDFFPKRETYFEFLKKCFINDKILKPNDFLNREFHSCIAYYFENGIYTKDVDRHLDGNMQQDRYNYCDDYEHNMTNDYLNFREIFDF